MSEINFKRDYGYAPPAPFWLVWNEDGRTPMFKHPDRDAAETEAARLATDNPGRSFYVLVAMATISTSTEIVGARFDPTRTPIVKPEEAQSPPEPAFINTDEEPF